MKATTTKHVATAGAVEIKPIEYAYGKLHRNEYKLRWVASAEFVESKKESLDSLLRDYRAQIVLDMRADGHTETEISRILETSKQEIAKLVIRATANAYGLDGQSAVELVNQAGNGVTKVAIESIVKQGIKDKAPKAEIAVKLQELGLITKESKTRDPRNAGGVKATKATRTAKVIAQLEKIEKDTIAGKLESRQILDKLEDMIAEISLKG